MKVGVISLGCPKNLTDTEVILGKLVESGYQLTNDQNEAEIMIVSTCAFIGPAKDESFAVIKDASKLKSKGKLKFLVVAGCLPKRYKNELFDKFKEVDAIVGPGSVDKIIDVLKKLGKQKKISLLEGTHCLFTHKTPRIKATPKHYAYIKISDGCNNRCSYCVVPSLRGKYKSRPMDSIVKEVKQLTKNGLKEAILVAQDTAMYGMDIYGRSKLHILVAKLAKIRRLKWIRIMYAHPAHVTKELIKAMKNERKVCRYLDLPIQHSCDRILSLMRRKISSQELKKLIANLKENVPNLAVRTSIIVGFPGETDKDFKELVDYIKEERFERLGAFKYFKEEGTPAAKMRGQITEGVKLRRLDKLLKVQRLISRRNNLKLEGKVIEVIADRIVKEGTVGRSYMDAPDIDGTVLIKNKKIEPGRVIRVKVKGSSHYDLVGFLT
ncbi:30S ribosomal protein S12 methylthiotransferase RimO [Candidatus Margulisiibacteriota bacterium]